MISKEMLKRFTSRKVDLMGDGISDIIQYESMPGKRKYKNLMTGKESELLNTVTRERRYILVRKDAKVSGGYIFLDKDFIGIVIAALKDGRWVEKGRFMYTEKLEMARKGSPVPDTLTLFDICGQAAGLDKFRACEMCRLNASPRMLVPPDIDMVNFPVDAAQKVRQFFGNRMTMKNLALDGRYFLDVINSMYYIEETVLYQQEKDGCGDGNEYDEYEDEDEGPGVCLYIPPMEIPEGALDAIEKLKAPFLRYPHNFMFSIIHKDNGRLFLRNFVMERYVGPSMKMEAEAVEYYREDITEGCKGNNGLIIWYDVEDSPLSYVSHLFRDVTDFVWESICQGNSAVYTVELAEKKFSTYKKSSVLKDMVKIAHVAVKHPIIERVISPNVDKNGCIKKQVFTGFASGLDSSIAYYCFGRTDESAEKLNQALMLPAGLLEIAIKLKNIRICRFLKNAFSDNMDYFLRMNREDLEWLVDICEEQEFLSNDNDLSFWSDVMNMMFEVSGIKNWDKAMEVMREVSPFSLHKYLIWARYAVKNNGFCKEVAYKYGWKLDRSTIIDAVGYVEMLRGITSEQAEAYKKASGKWDRYSFKKDGYLVTYPKSPEDLLLEGVKLNHCAKEYVAPVAEGLTTVLFIRQQDSPDKPFFTLEVKDEKVRQCHGYNNCNVEEDSSLDGFLKEFCKEKGVGYSRGDTILGVNDTNVIFL